MASASLSTRDPLLIEQLLAPAFYILQNSIRGVREEGALPDTDLVRCGVMRTLSQSRSGRDLLQHLSEVHKIEVARSTYFGAHHSKRRRDILSQLNTQLVAHHRADLPDLLAGFPQLKNRSVFAVDGQHIGHGVHAAVDEEQRYVSVNTLYLTCLHSGLLFNLGAVQGDGEHHHEMPVFRVRITDWLLKHRNRRSPPPIFVVDAGFVDNTFWTRMRLAAAQGALFITRTKENMTPEVCGNPPWDRGARINQGVTADELVGFDNACVMRRVQYADPESGTAYEFLTTILDLPPGLIALLFLLRWRIEKIFDTAKNKLEETKAWANGALAQDTQAHVLALTHNLLVLIRDKLAREHGIQELKVVQKRETALERRHEMAASCGRVVAHFQEKLPPIVQLTVQFIRTLRNGILGKLRWLAAVAHLRTSMEKYL